MTYIGELKIDTPFVSKEIEYWDKDTTIYSLGQILFDKTNRKFKIGNSINIFKELEYQK